jgi:hypothetical protein
VLVEEQREEVESLTTALILPDSYQNNITRAIFKIVPGGGGHVSLLHRLEEGSGGHAASYPKGTWTSIPRGRGVNEPECEAAHLPPSKKK